eukprot:CAMPEP_0194033052 /NCGR_PEP_ID=MMETSP0009_2-20130614/5862_1 /TAXON_ID=210454 /ORGANISM="Grammatophora oceanica, Strain CCMP 410" /LENGTH=296 /DNA_ID=CAMNT_0038673661 /DNA_START=38 /DNA_END=925 /DNA_ORIENTATION=-
MSKQASSEGCLPAKFVVVTLIALVVGNMCPPLFPKNSPSSIPSRALRKVPDFGAACNDELTASDQEGALVSKTSYSSGPGSWCPDATCVNTDLCEPCKRRYLIILATGRSGSTTLMNMIGKLPGIRMAGENNDMLGHLRDLEKGVLENAQFVHHNSGDLTDWEGPWKHNPILDGSLSCVSQTVIETINPPRVDEEGHFLVKDEATKIFGFKTIRLLKQKSEKTDAEVAKWLTDVLPCARFLVNIRSDIEGQAQSYASAFNAKKDKSDDLRDMNRRMRTLQETLGSSRAFLTDSAEW